MQKVEQDLVEETRSGKVGEQDNAQRPWWSKAPGHVLCRPQPAAHPEDAEITVSIVELECRGLSTKPRLSHVRLN